MENIFKNNEIYIEYLLSKAIHTPSKDYNNGTITVCLFCDKQLEQDVKVINHNINSIQYCTCEKAKLWVSHLYKIEKIKEIYDKNSEYINTEYKKIIKETHELKVKNEYNKELRELKKKYNIKLS